MRAFASHSGPPRRPPPSVTSLQTEQTCDVEYIVFEFRELLQVAIMDLLLPEAPGLRPLVALL